MLPKYIELLPTSTVAVRGRQRILFTWLSSTPSLHLHTLYSLHSSPPHLFSSHCAIKKKKGNPIAQNKKMSDVRFFVTSLFFSSLPPFFLFFFFLLSCFTLKLFLSFFSSLSLHPHILWYAPHLALDSTVH